MWILGALTARWWRSDHPRPVPWHEAMRRLARLMLLVVQTVSPDPGRADDATVRVPSAPLVRARAILTAAPPASRAPARARAAAA